MSYRVLIVEDEATLLSALCRGLSSLPGVEVEGCSSGEQALEHLTRSVPDLAVLDINLPGISGLDLIEDLSAHMPPVPVVVTTAYAHVHRDRLELHPHLVILEKPVPLERLRRLVGDRAAGAVEDHDSGPFQIADYIQLASLGHHSVALEVVGEGGEGRLEVVEGEIWNARCGSLTGEAAVERLLERRARRIRCIPLGSPPERREISIRSENLLLDIARRQDEARRDREGLGAGPAEGDDLEPLLALGSELQPPEDEYEELFASAVAAYLERRHERALELLEECRRRRPDDPRAIHNIERIQARRREP